MCGLRVFVGGQTFDRAPSTLEVFRHTVQVIYIMLQITTELCIELTLSLYVIHCIYSGIVTLVYICDESVCILTCYFLTQHILLYIVSHCKPIFCKKEIII